MLIKILWFAAYIVVGCVTFWLLSKEDCYFMKRLDNECGTNWYRAKNKYLHYTKWQPNDCTDPWVLTIGCVLAIVFVLLWPIVTICCVIWYPIAYRIAIKTES